MKRSSLTTLACLSLAAVPATWIGAALSSTPAGAQDQDTESAPVMPLVKNLSRSGDGLPICGLGKDFHAGRRQALREALGNEGVLVLRGLPGVRDYRTFRQDKNFWWLVGVESPNVAFAMDLKTGREVLFVGAPSRMKEQWEGEIWDADDAWVPELTGIQEIRVNSPARRGKGSKNEGLLEVVGEMLEASGGPIWVSGTAHIGITSAYDSANPFNQRRKSDSLDGRESREDMLRQHLEERFEVEVKSITRAMDRLRVHKTPEEVDAIRRASRAGALAMAEAIRSTRPGLGEWDVSALMAWQHQRHGADGDAYAAIAGSGPNSLTLHYNFSSRRMNDGEMLLVDYGPEVDHYVTDITRTWPVNGEFSERQAELYDAVLAAQQAAIDAARPGVSLGELGSIANGVLKDRGFAQFIRHGVCHHVGMEVHDPGPTGDLKPGACFTIEPGLYEPETDIGIRIEDVVVITEDGCELLTADCPRSRAEIEALYAEQGILELIEGR